MYLFLTRLFSELANLVAVLALTIQVWTTLPIHFQIPLLIVLLLGLVVPIWGSLDFVAKRPQQFQPGAAGINTYLCEWLSKGGRSAIFSRDLSWGAMPEPAKVLRKKAEDKSLIICVADQSKVADELEVHGAEVYCYSHLGFEPRVRFTVIDYGRADARVAIGFVESGGKFVIREYSAADQAVVALANDLIAFARRTQEITKS